MSEPKQVPDQALALVPEVVSAGSLAVRDRTGKWLKGTGSGNPGGMRKTERQQLDLVRKAARKHSQEAIETLANLMRSGPPKVQAMCAQALLDRAWGKPPQTIAAEGGGAGMAVGIVILPPETE